MKRYSVEIWFRYVVGEEMEKDFEHHVINANSPVDAESEIRGLYGSKYRIFNCDVTELKPIHMTKETMFNLTSPK